MYIEEIILDGFKSYAQRTKIGPFDPQFNAITGLNGSGKSNILDAICFVLGISNLRQVRVTDMAGLVYKKGHGGIKKASVTVTFNNDDPSKSPVGYEHTKKIHVTRQVVVEGKSKYLINGITAQQKTVQLLFQSVQLNVNNPNFLIMQGHILRVVKMKPEELLGMLEEAAGTKMFETRRAESIDVLAKKQQKVDETNDLIDNEITPTLNKLREEQKNYIEYNQSIKEIEETKRMCTAFDYYQAMCQILQFEEAIYKEQQRQEAFEAQSEDVNAELEQLDQDQKKIMQIIEQKEKDKGPTVSELEGKVSHMAKELAKGKADHNHAVEMIQTEKEKLAEIEENIKATEQSSLENKSSIEKAKSDQARLEKESAAENEKFQELQQAALTGVSSKDNAGTKSFADQIMDLKKQSTEAQSKRKQLDTQVQHMNNELKSLQNEHKTAGVEETKLQKEFNSCNSSVEALKKEISQIKFDPEEERNLIRRKNEITAEVNKLRTQVVEKSAGLSRFDFNYTSPSANFDHSKVFGLVANIMEVKEVERYATAIEVSAGGRLYNVIVKDDKTGVDLIQKGNLKWVTIIPLNKIRPNPLPQKTINNAEKLVGKENVSVALNLVGYPTEVVSAMEYVFGSTLITKNMQMAKALAFDPNVRSRTVTEQGDVFDPKGTISGGSRANSTSILIALTELNKIKKELAKKEESMRQIEQELNSITKIKEKYCKIEQEIELKLEELKNLQERLNRSPHHALMNKVNELEKGIKERKEQMSEMAKKEKEYESEAKKLESSIKDEDSARKSEEKKLQAEVNQSKKHCAALNQKAKEAMQTYQRISLELAESEKEIVSLKNQKNEVINSIKLAEEKEKEIAQTLEEHKKIYNEQKSLLDQKKKELAEKEKQITEINKKRNNLVKVKDELELNKKKSEHEINRINKEKSDVQAFLNNLEQKNNWISIDKQLFGQKNSEFDFSNYNNKAQRAKLAKLEALNEKLGQTINRKVMNMYDKVDREYKDLTEKKEAILRDRAEIEKFIGKLDEEKIKALKMTYDKVNKDFATIFGSLLPGWSCKIVPPAGKTIADGLEIKFSRDGVWKDSLAELSGGQRSLLALSLILSLLLFKPAPVYILDEVDSALDLSNTQNIGQMLKKHFGQSQFIIVSLKEGMWNNANVLFKTKFVDGVSTVTRFVPKQQQIPASP